MNDPVRLYNYLFFYTIIVWTVSYLYSCKGKFFWPYKRKQHQFKLTQNKNDIYIIHPQVSV